MDVYLEARPQTFARDEYADMVSRVIGKREGGSG
jgi:hypothetical protein